jgi:hypothetical protein
MLAAWVPRNSHQPGPDLRGAGPSPAREQPTDGRWRHPEAESAELAGDPPMAPARILPCQHPHVGRRGRASLPAGRLPPLSAHERPMPTQQRARGDQARAARGAWQLARHHREQGTIPGAKLRPRDLATEDLELVAQDEQLDVLDVQATTTANECPHQSPQRHLEKREGHRADPPNPAREGRDTSIGALQACEPSPAENARRTTISLGP